MHLEKNRFSEGASPKLFLNKSELAIELGLPSTRIVDSWVRKRMIPVIDGGHRTKLFNLEKVLIALDKFEIKAVGQT